MQKDNLGITHIDGSKRINNPRPISNGVKKFFFITTFIFSFTLLPNISFAQDSRHVAINEKIKSMMGGWSSPTGLNQGNNSMMNFGFTPFGEFGWIFMFVFWSLIIWAIVALVRGSFGKDHMCGHDHSDDAHGKDKSPLEILKERYAKGEIDKKEFEVKKKDLS
ncbi:MAG: hypothetical protein US74_C0008G0007 [Parcubacteria group bacterium GW2011_GWA2_38_13]|nr:MAG: hypothetical protein US74_C0008G0007 [Parcubacteria group bacterium GW2011_GWA2_38_13]